MNARGAVIMEDNRSTLTKSKCTRAPSACRVCGVSALYSYYGAVVCPSCKVFFKRNALTKQKLLKCHFDGHCQINEHNRNVCAACRVDKCFEVGMQIDMFRGSQGKGSRPRKKKQATQIVKLPTLNLVEKDLSSLNESQWIVLRNIINSYDQSPLVSLANQFKSSSQHSTTRNLATVHDYVTSVYDVAGAYLRLNSDIHQLPFDDRSILLHTAADNGTCLTGVFFVHQFDLVNDEVFWGELLRTYGTAMMDCHRRAGRFVPPDLILFKLVLALFSFSNNSRSFHPNISTEYVDPKAILAIENSYAELIWRYLVYKYQHDQAIKMFLRFTEWLLAINMFMYHAHNTQPHVEDINWLIEKTEMTLILDDVDRIA